MALNSLDPLTGLLKKKSGYDPTGANSFRDAQGGYNDGANGYTTPPPVLPSSPTNYSGTTTIPGWQPDYKSLIANDPNFLQLQKDLAAASASDLASRNAMINKALVSFGSVPDLASAAKQLGFDVGGAVDSQTAGVAANNPYSTQANLLNAHNQAITQLKHALAARHALQSGELGYQLGQENKSYGQAQYDATQKLLDYISGVQAAYAQAEQQRAMQEAQGRNDAARFQSGLPQNQGKPDQTATLDEGLSKQYGKPVYRGPDGKLYNQDGSPFTPPSAETSTATIGLPAYTPPAALQEQLQGTNAHYGGIQL